MFPERLLDVTVREDRIVPRYLTTRDHHWVESLRDVLTACLGKPRAAVEERLANGPAAGPWRAVRAMTHLLLGLHGFDVAGAADPVEVRRRVFREAASSGPGFSRAAILERVSVATGLAIPAIEAGLFADLPEARVLKPMKPALSTPDLIDRYNLALVQGLIVRCRVLRVAVAADLKAVLRFARLKQLICRVRAPARPGEPAGIEVSGPLSLFRFTTKYGHAMASWIPALSRSPDWKLDAECVLGGRSLRFLACSRDPVGTTHVPVIRFDSRVEERFFRDFLALGSSWQVLREADPVQVGGRIACPDFTLEDRSRGLRVPVEIVGYWTPEYLRDKMALIRGLPAGTTWIVCLDSDLADGAGVEGQDTFPYRRRIDASRFLDSLEARVQGRFAESMTPCQVLP